MSVEEWLSQLSNWLNSVVGLNPEFSMLISQMYLFSYWYGYPFFFISGFRDPERQRELQILWDAGRRMGLAARPSSNSKHCNTNFDAGPDSLAVDIHTENPLFYAKIAEIGAMFGVHWGGNFRTADQVHFYI